jgi:Tol biopolymer transport system component
MCDSDGSNVRQLTSFGDISYTASPIWSADGRWILFLRIDSGRDMYLINSEGGKAQRVGPNSANNSPDCWSRDGKWVYFTSDITGQPQVWRIEWSPDGHLRHPAQITHKGGSTARVSPDGRVLSTLRTMRLTQVYGWFRSMAAKRVWC